MRAAALALALLALVPFADGASLAAQIVGAPPPPQIEWRQALGARVPLEARFTDHEGHELALADCFGERPVVLALVYYQCPMLCGLVLEGMVKALRGLELTTGADFDVLVVSIDPRETPALAAGKRKSALAAYGLGEADAAARSWRFLVGSEASVRALADAVGFEYTYLPGSDQFAHGAGITVLTPAGVVSRILFGVEFAPRDVRLALVEASQGAIGTPFDQVLLRCFEYDPEHGRYGFAVLAAVRSLGLVTLAILLFFVLRWLARERRAAHLASQGA